LLKNSQGGPGKNVRFLLDMSGLDRPGARTHVRRPAVNEKTPTKAEVFTQRRKYQK